MWMRLMLLKGYWVATLGCCCSCYSLSNKRMLGKGSVQGTHQGNIWLKKNDSDERDQAQHHLEESDSATMEEDDSYGPPQDRNEDDFHLNDDLLFRLMTYYLDPACVAVSLGLAAASCCFLLYVCIVGLENMV